MKKLFSFVMLLLVFSSNFFNFGFANELEEVEGLESSLDDQIVFEDEETILSTGSDFPPWEEKIQLEEEIDNIIQEIFVESGDSTIYTVGDLTQSWELEIIPEVELDDTLSENIVISGNESTISSSFSWQETDYNSWDFMELSWENLAIDTIIDSWWQVDIDNPENVEWQGSGELLENEGPLENDILSESEDSEETGDNVQLPDLIISEVFFGWNKEWIEVYNAWVDFQWDLILSGVYDGSHTRNYSDVIIPHGWTQIFGNTNANLILWDIDYIVSSPWLRIWDGSEIFIQLIYSWDILDEFGWSAVYGMNNRSLHRLLSTREIIYTTTWYSLNVSGNFFANPGYVFPQEIEPIDPIEPDIPELTWYDDIPVPIDCEEFINTNSIQISEIFIWNSTYPTYVEIQANPDNYTQIYLTWSAVNQQVSFSLDWLWDDFIMLTANPLRQEKWRKTSQNSSLQLNSSWWLLLYWVDSQWDTLFDIVYIASSSAGNSIYKWNQNIECAKVFSHMDKFSPWMTSVQSEFIQITPDPIVQYITIWWWGWWGWWTTSCPDAGGSSFNTSNSLSAEIQISAIKYHGNSQILKLKNKTNNDINLSDYHLQFLDWSTKNLQWATLLAKTTMSFLWNYWVPTNQDFCVNLMMDNAVVDRYCRNSLTKASDTERNEVMNNRWWVITTDDGDSNQWDGDILWWQGQENIVQWDETSTGQTLINTNNIKIIDVDYDPSWADGDNESVTLLLLTWTQVNLSGYKFYYTKDGKTQKAKAQIQWILSYWNRQTFKWGFSFPNSTNDKKSVTVILISPDGNTVDTYVYNPNKITEIPAWNYKINSVVDGDTAKITYGGQEFTIRFAGIDAPESSALRCGKVECFWSEAKNYLKSLIEWKTVYFEPASIDGYDRMVGYISFNGENINEKMIRNWYAREYSYKNQSYKYQSSFKSAQNYAKNNQLWLRWNQCNGQRLCPVDETQMKYNFVFDIEKIIYDPEWNDNGNEEIWIKMIEWSTVEFGSDFYLLVNDTKKSLKKYGSISPWDTKKMVWTFGFPNNKETTVSLVYNGEILDTYIYNPETDIQLDENLSWDVANDFGEIKIMSILPNPYGADGSNEEISIFYSWWPPGLNLSWFYLKVWTTKKNLSWNLYSDQETILKWKFSFPNKWACVEIGYGNQIFDKFCYTQPAEWQKFYISNGVLASLSTLDLSILKDSKLQNIGNKVCLVYAGQKFYCKNMPYSKLSTKRVRQNKMYKSFFDSFEDYMKDKRKIMYYDSEIKNYFELLDDVEDVISDGKSTLEIDWINYEISEFEAMYNAKYKKDPQNFILKYLDSLLPDWVSQKYHSLLQEYKDYLFQKNPPNI